MEGANEAPAEPSTRSLNAYRLRAPRCAVWSLQEPPIFGPARAADKLRWKALRRNARPLLQVAPDGALQPTGPLARILVDWLPRFSAAHPGVNRPFARRLGRRVAEER